jgi:hypothetical protein
MTWTFGFNFENTAAESIPGYPGTGSSSRFSVRPTVYQEKQSTSNQNLNRMFPISILHPPVRETMTAINGGVSKESSAKPVDVALVKEVNRTQGGNDEGIGAGFRKKGSEKHLKVGVCDLSVAAGEDVELATQRSEHVSEDEVRAYEGLLSADDALPYWQSSEQAWSPANARDLDLLSARRPTSHVSLDTAFA